jgi:hypothetical protein
MSLSTTKPVRKPKAAKIEEATAAVINRGGSDEALSSAPQEPGEERFTYNNIKVWESDARRIKALREKRPKPRGVKRLAISLENWIQEAIQEKLERDEKADTNTA